jgi:outer membrane protein assembly factor BamA
MRSGIGPRMRNEFNGELDSIGATTYAIGTVEVNFPLGLPEAFGLEGAVFSDFGTAFGAPEKRVIRVVLPNLTGMAVRLLAIVPSSAKVSPSVPPLVLV